MLQSGNECEGVLVSLVLQRGLLRQGWRKSRDLDLERWREHVRRYREHVRERERKRHDVLLRSLYTMTHLIKCQ